MPAAVWFGNVVKGSYMIRDNVKYAYDKMGNICKVYENGEMTIRYTYDKLSRLVREDNKRLGKTWVYAYDHCGNIIRKREFNYTLRETDLLEELTETEVKQYGYDGDRLMNYGEETFDYDDIGNPTTYRSKVASWSKGRQLENFDGIAFTYDSQGRRLSKGNITFSYDSDGRILKQGDGLEFYYDETGVSGVKYDNVQYIYRKDAQGNIIAILDTNGNVVVKYTYDAWGNHDVLDANGNKIAATDHIGIKNPFRYRGYYYDETLDLYYLQTRYYDPEVGRFITIDGIEYIDPETINGLNLYAYCGNNPVMGYDPDGTMPKWLKKLSGWAMVGVLTVAAVVMITVVAVGTVVSSGLLAAVLVGAGVGILSGMGGSIIAQGGLSNIKNINPWSVFASGAIGGAIGAFSGATSFAFTQIGNVVGQYLGFVLSNARHIGTGIKIAQVFGLTTSMLVKAGSVVGGMLGGILGGSLVNSAMNDLVSDTPYKNYDVDSSNRVRSLLLKIFKWLNPIRK